MFVTKELVLHEDINIEVTVKDQYLITDVFIVIKGIVRDQNKEFRFRIHEPYDRLINHILDCKKSGNVIRK